VVVTADVPPAPWHALEAAMAPDDHSANTAEAAMAAEIRRHPESRRAETTNAAVPTPPPMRLFTWAPVAVIDLFERLF
jgi:hypothetical protein